MRTYPTVGKVRPDPEYFTYFRTGMGSRLLLGWQRFIQQFPRNTTFTNKPRIFYLFSSHSAKSAPLKPATSKKKQQILWSVKEPTRMTKLALAPESVHYSIQTRGLWCIKRSEYGFECRAMYAPRPFHPHNWKPPIDYCLIPAYGGPNCETAQNLHCQSRILDQPRLALYRTR